MPTLPDSEEMLTIDRCLPAEQRRDGPAAQPGALEADI